MSLLEGVNLGGPIPMTYRQTCALLGLITLIPVTHTLMGSFRSSRSGDRRRNEIPQNDGIYDHSG